MAVESSRPRSIRKVHLVAWILLVVAIVVVALVRIGDRTEGPSIKIVDREGRMRSVSLASIREMPAIARRGTYQNQYANWRDEGVYVGVLLRDLIGSEATYDAVRVAADDGYTVVIERARLEDPDYPVVLAFEMDGVSVPEWEDGYRIAVLPEDGSVSNEEFGVESAGSFWVKNVVRITLQ